MSIGAEMLADMAAESAWYERTAEDAIASRTWITKDGRKIPVSEMTDSHLLNSLRMLLRGGNGCFEGMSGDAIEMLADEAKARGLTLKGGAV